MKKYIYSSLIISSVLALASCAADEPGISHGNGNSVTFTVQIPGEFSTRYSSGESVNQLYYSIFNSEGKALDTGNQPWVQGAASAQVTLDLVPGQQYQVVFFACNSSVTSKLTTSEEAFNTGYAYNPTTGEFKINYENVAVNDDKYDAFFTKVSGITTTTDTSSPIELKRPFAQINIGTNDLDKEIVTSFGLTNYKTTLNVAPDNLASGMSLLNGTYTSAEASEGSVYAISKTIDGLSQPTDSFPVKNYKYLDMMYVLVEPSAAGQTLLNASFQVYANGVTDPIQNVNLASMPVRPNYMTNIYGSLLTSSKDFNVTIAPGYEGMTDVDEWDGTTYTDVDLTQNPIILNSAADLAGFVKKISTRPSEFHLPNPVVLTSDVNFKNNPIEGMGIYQVYDLNFDGQNHTIYNLNINNSNTYTGLIPVIVDGSVKNLNFVGANVTGNRVAVLCGNAQYANFSNITFTDCKVNGDKKVAVAVAYCQASPSERSISTFTNITVNKSTITSSNGQAGAINGYASVATYDKCAANDCTVTVTGVDKNNFTLYGSSCFVGAMGNGFGTNNSLTFTGCTMTGCTLTYTGTDAGLQTAFQEAQNRLWGCNSDATGTITVDGTVEYSK